MDLSRTYTWEMPTKLIIGPGCSRQAGVELKKLGAGRVLIVTDRGVEGAGVLTAILEGLSAAGVEHAIYNGVEANPSIRCVDEAAALYRAEGCDSLLGVGGGSSMDTAKVVGVVINNPGVEVPAIEGVGKFKNAIPPLIAIPTTCGTGSEVTGNGIITDTKRHYKIAVVSPFLYPKVSLIDGLLLVKLPAPVIAGTGMDALCHALESYTSQNSNPVSDALDLAAIRMISQWLRPAVANGNLEAMAQMVLASTVAGMGFANTRVTLVHAMSHPVSAHYGVPHGVANAILLPLVMELNLIGNPQRHADVASAMGENTAGMTAMEAARLSVKAVRELSRDVGIPESFKVFGVTEEHLPAMIEDTFKSGGVPLNPTRVRREDVVEIYRKLI